VLVAAARRPVSTTVCAGHGTEPVNQFSVGRGDYTKERENWLGEISLDYAISQIKAGKNKAQPVTLAGTDSQFDKGGGNVFDNWQVMVCSGTGKLLAYEPLSPSNTPCKLARPSRVLAFRYATGLTVIMDAVIILSMSELAIPPANRLERLGGDREDQ
jgi:hypothetical protein